MILEVDRLIQTNSTREDTTIDRAIRPKSLQDYIGQDQVKKKLQIYIQASLKRKEPLDHVLIYGPPGLGKTTLANIIANELEVGIKQTSGPVLEKAGDLAAILTNLEPNDVLFIDEIHRLSPTVEEVLYPAMEDHKIDIIIGEGPSARSIKLDLPSFTLIGATTRAGLLTSPLRDRFGIVERLEYYKIDDLAKIINRSASILQFHMNDEACFEVAKRSRGTPRIANRLLRRVRDVIEVGDKATADHLTTKHALDFLDVDTSGLDLIDRKLITTIMDIFEGGPVGIDALAAAIGEERGTLEDVIEPFLIQIGFIMRTPRGRIATNHAYKHFGIESPLKDNQNLKLTFNE